MCYFGCLFECYDNIVFSFIESFMFRPLKCFLERMSEFNKRVASPASAPNQMMITEENFFFKVINKNLNLFFRLFNSPMFTAVVVVNSQMKSRCSGDKFTNGFQFESVAASKANDMRLSELGSFYGFEILLQ